MDIKLALEGFYGRPLEHNFVGDNMHCGFYSYEIGTLNVLKYYYSGF